VDDAFDVIVIGGGGAGLAAAVSAAEAGASVLLFESERELGGSTQLSAGLFTAADTSVQRALGIEDSAEKFFQHYMDLNQWVLRPGLIHTFCEQAAPTLEWLIGLGVEIPAVESGNAHQPGLARAGVEDVWRAHVPKDQGYGLIQVLDRARRGHGVEVVLNTRVEELLVTDGRVAGVVADGIEVRGGAVVVATGGFAQDPGFVDRYFPAARAAGAIICVSAPGSTPHWPGTSGVCSCRPCTSSDTTTGSPVSRRRRGCTSTGTAGDSWTRTRRMRYPPGSSTSRAAPPG
jgi:fumarate reductase flavoprotein subunit